MSQETISGSSSSTSSVDDPITSVVDFIKALEAVKNDPFSGDEGAEIFYRGHADESWGLKPSIVRSDKGIENEHSLFRDMVARMPRDFSECKSALDYLVHMQHYGLPTRLLDVTTNPLVALYFACQPAGDTTVSGIVNAAFDAAYSVAFDAMYDVGVDSEGNEIICCDNNPTKEYLLSSVGIVAGVLTASNTRCQEDPIADKMLDSMLRPIVEESPHLEESIQKAVDEGGKAAIKAGPKDGAVYFFSVPKNRVKHYDSDTVSILSNLAKCGEIKINIDQNEELTTELEEEKDVQMGHEDPRLKVFNTKGGIQFLLHQIREEKSYFQPLIDPFDLCRTFLVKAKHGNPRIVNQAGAFFLFGLKCTHDIWGAIKLFKGRGEIVPAVPEKWIKKKLIIPKKYKAGILRELALLGITDSYIYPGMEQYAKELKKKYEL